MATCFSSDNACSLPRSNMLMADCLQETSFANADWVMPLARRVDTTQAGKSAAGDCMGATGSCGFMDGNLPQDALVCNQKLSTGYKIL